MAFHSAMCAMYDPYFHYVLYGCEYDCWDRQCLHQCGAAYYVDLFEDFPVLGVVAANYGHKQSPWMIHLPAKSGICHIQRRAKTSATY